LAGRGGPRWCKPESFPIARFILDRWTRADVLTHDGYSYLSLCLYHVPGCDFGLVSLCLVFHVLMMLLVDTLEMLRFSPPPFPSPPFPSPSMGHLLGYVGP
jgi:hypothetical protein